MESVPPIFLASSWPLIFGMLVGCFKPQYGEHQKGREMDGPSDGSP